MPMTQPASSTSQGARRLILHAGMHKTGSTTIQHFLDGEVLKNARYFKGPKANHSFLFRLLFGDHPESHRTYQLQGLDRAEVLKLREAQLAELAAELDATDITTYVFSGEHVSTANSAEMARCRDFFAGWFPEIEVYAYVRSPMKFAVSMFQQHLKFGAQPGIRNILPEYRDRVGNLDAVFGRDHVHLRAFDGAEARIPDILPDFLAWAGLEAVPAPQDWYNTSLSAEATALLYALRRRLNRGLKGSEEVRLWTALVRHLQQIGTQKYSFDPALFGPVRDAVLKDHAWVETRMGQRFPDPLVPGSEQYRFASLEEIRLLGLTIFKSVTGEPLGKPTADQPFQLKQVVGMLQAALS